jgi:hypothetical protein
MLLLDVEVTSCLEAVCSSLHSTLCASYARYASRHNICTVSECKPLTCENARAIPALSTSPCSLHQDIDDASMTTSTYHIPTPLAPQPNIPEYMCTSIQLYLLCAIVGDSKSRSKTRGDCMCRSRSDEGLLPTFRTRSSADMQLGQAEPNFLA